MPNKPQKWGLKVWCLACSTSKYVWSYKVYCGKEISLPQVEDPISLANSNTHGVRQGEPKLAHNVVMKMVDGLANFGHHVVMDNFFSSIGLFMELLSLGIYATSTVRPNRVGLPMDLKDTKRFKNSLQGFVLWRTHNNQQVCCVMWKDKKPMLLILTHALPIQAPCEFPMITVPRWNSAVQNGIPTSPVVLKYTMDMRGVDVADQLRASFSCQVWSHKWWHHVFFSS